MKQFRFLIPLLCLSIMSCLEVDPLGLDLPEIDSPPIDPLNLFDDNNNGNSFSNRIYCNEEPRLLFEHSLTEDALTYLSVFSEKSELKFKKLNSKYSKNLDFENLIEGTSMERIAFHKTCVGMMLDIISNCNNSERNELIYRTIHIFISLNFAKNRKLSVK